MNAGVSNRSGRPVMNLFLGSGLGLVGRMLLAGLLLRASQAGWIPMSADSFYAVLTLHGAGMIVGLSMCGMGGLWYLVRRRIRLNPGIAVAWPGA